MSNSPLPSATATSTNSSRAAVLCFGSWGLQTLLQTWPRLRLLQEERQALGIAGSLPDLDRLTSFAAIVPRLDAVPGEAAGIELVRAAAGRYPPPGYLDLNGEADAPDRAAPGLTESELPAAYLLRRGQADGYLEPLAVTPSEAPALAAADAVSGRAGMYRLALAQAPALVAALVGEVIDPTRLDDRQTRDPFVQTTVYVVASLAEPHASALVWPVVGELRAALGERHIARVVGLFGTGSFAGGANRAVEEAAVYAGLRELEFLLRPSSREAPVAWHGPLFDRVYLVDREKTNQSLAASPGELAVLVANALEAFLAAGGADLVEERLSHDEVTGSTFPYSVLGTACDYVPLGDYLAAAMAGEQRQILQSEVLAAAADSGDAGATAPGLADLGAAPGDTLACTLAAGAAAAFEPLPDAEGGAGAGQATWPDTLRVARDFLVSPAVARKLGQAQTLVQWRQLVDARLAEAAVEIGSLCAAVEAAWGAAAAVGNRGAGQAEDPLAVRARDAAITGLTATICRAPGSLLQARDQAAAWAAQAEAALAALSRSWRPGAGDDAYRRGVAAVQRGWSAAAARNERAGRWAAAGAGLGLLLAAVIVAGLAAGPGLPVAGLQGLAVVLAAGLLAAAGGWAGWVLATQPVRRLKQRWLALGQEHLAWQARVRLHGGLLRFYEALYVDLAGLQAGVQAAIDDLSAWTAPADGTRPPALATSATHLRLAHGGDWLWQAVQAQVAQAAAGEPGREAFHRAWRGQGRTPDLGRRVAGLLRAHVARRGPGGPGAWSAGQESLAGMYREYALLAASYLRSQGQWLTGYGSLVRQVAQDAGIEQLLFDSTATPAGGEDLAPVAFLEDLYVRAKPAANYEITSRLSPDAGEVEFLVTPAGSGSRLTHAAEQRGLVSLPSLDPLAISLVRVLGGLALEDLALTARCRRAYQHLSQAQREALDLLPEAAMPDTAQRVGAAQGT